LVAPSVALVVACSGADSPIVGGGSDDDDDSTHDAAIDGTFSEGDGSTSGGDASSGSDGSAVDGGVVGTTGPCDDALPVYGNARSFAHALGICTLAAKDGFGLVSARFTSAYVDGDGGVGSGNPAGHVFGDAGTTVQAGVLRRFGDTLVPREGKALGVLSTGYAGQFDEIDDGGAHDSGPAFASSTALGTTGILPPGYPRPTPGCEATTGTYDMVDVELTLKAPPDAHGFSFDYAFFGSDWPMFVCTQFNDAFAAYVRSSALHGVDLASDPKNRPISVNAAYVDHCTPDAGIPCYASQAQIDDAGLSWPCGAGTQELSGTGYGIVQTGCSGPASAGAGTGWLTASAPVSPGETFTIDLMIWDSGDGIIDSSTILDRFQWLAAAPTAGTTVAK
ncbi:MAG TPA: choice-of-anchor L domain-containing protein, partial [Polyangiaceae bacterium]